MVPPYRHSVMDCGAPAPSVAALSIPTHTATVRNGPFRSLDDPSTPAGLVQVYMVSALEAH